MRFLVFFGQLYNKLYIIILRILTHSRTDNNYAYNQWRSERYFQWQSPLRFFSDRGVGGIDCSGFPGKCDDLKYNYLYYIDTLLCINSRDICNLPLENVKSATPLLTIIIIIIVSIVGRSSSAFLQFKSVPTPLVVVFALHRRPLPPTTVILLLFSDDDNNNVREDGSLCSVLRQGHLESRSELGKQLLALSDKST